MPTETESETLINLDTLIGASIKYPSLRPDLKIPHECLEQLTRASESYGDLIDVITSSSNELNRQGVESMLHAKGFVPIEMAATISVLNRCAMRNPRITESQAKALLDSERPKWKRMWLHLQMAEANRTYMKERDEMPVERAFQRYQRRIGHLSVEEAPEGDDPLAVKPTINLKRSDLPKPVTALVDYLAQQTCEAPAAKHVFAALGVLAALAGKHVAFHNWGSDYYVNLALAILGNSGDNKTGLCNTIERFVKARIPTYCPATSTIEAFVNNYAETIQTGKRTGDELRRLKQEVYNKHRDNLNGELVLIDEFRAFLLTMLPDKQAVRNGQLLCRLLDASSIEMDTITHGCRVLGPTAFTFLGFSQTDPWNSEVRTATMQSGGLAGRIVPVNSSAFQIAGYEINKGDDLEETCDRWIKAIKTLLTGEQINDAPFDGDVAPVVPSWHPHGIIRVSFGEPGTDALGQAKEQFRLTRLAAHARENETHEYALLEPKILIQAAKIAAILSLAEAAEGSEGVQHGLNAGKWLPIAYALVGTAHLSNLYHQVQMTEQGKRVDQILAFIKRKGEATKRDITRNFNLKGFEADDVLKTLVDAGDLQPSDSPWTKKYRVRSRK